MPYKVFANIRLKTVKEGAYRIVSLELELEGSSQLRTPDLLFASFKTQAIEKFGADFVHIVNVRMVPPDEQPAQPVKIGAPNGTGKAETG